MRLAIGRPGLAHREIAGGEDADFAKRLGDMRKVVVSNQELEFTWRNTEQLRGDVVEAVTALKNEPNDAGIVVPGSISLVRQLLDAGLVDRLHLMVHPIGGPSGPPAVRRGTADPAPAGLVGGLRDGVLNLVYEPGPAPGDAGYEEAKARLAQSD